MKSSHNNFFLHTFGIAFFLFQLGTLSGLKLQTTEPIFNVLDQLLKRQQDILQSFEVPAAFEKIAATAMAAPATVLKSNLVKPASVTIPSGTRIEIISVDVGGEKPVVPLKPYVHSKVTYDSDKAPYVEVEVPAAILDMLY
jgi:hypothetical protein